MAVVLGLLLHHILFCCSRPRRGVLLVVLLVPLQRVVRHDLVLVDLLLLVVDEGSRGAFVRYLFAGGGYPRGS